MTISNCLSQINADLLRLRTIDLGYPQGENKILVPTAADVIETSLMNADLLHHQDIRTFFNACNGMSLPDVYVGYFLNKVESLAPKGKPYEVLEVLGSFAGGVVVLGSSGGGDLFVLRRNDNDVLLLPPGLVSNGAYDNTDARGSQLATGFGSFLQRLAEDVRAFVNNKPGHRFMLRSPL